MHVTNLPQRAPGPAALQHPAPSSHSLTSSLALQDCPRREPGQSGPRVWCPPCLEPCPLVWAQDWLQNPHRGENTVKGRASREGPWQEEGIQAGTRDALVTCCLY